MPAWTWSRAGKTQGSRPWKGRMMRRATISTLTLVTSMGTALAQDIAAGETSFRKCQLCHDVGENAKNKLGPELDGLNGRKAGSVENFNYSEGLKSSGINWTQETFKEFIKDPRGKIPSTTMLFPGIKDDKELGDLWAYLMQFGPDGKKQ
jgi:cytochrome c